MSGPGTPRSLPPLGENAVTRTFLAIHNNPETVKEGGVVIRFLQINFGSDISVHSKLQTCIIWCAIEQSLPP